MEQVRILKGTVVKMLLNWSYEGQSLTLDDVDFHVEYFTNANARMRVGKQFLTKDDIDGNWYLYVDTNAIGNGTLKVRVYASIPDADAPNGIRQDNVECTTNVTVFS